MLMRKSFALALFCVLALPGCIGSSGKESPRKTVDLKASVAYRGLEFTITNKDAFDWTNVTMKVNHTWRLDTSRVATGGAYSVGVGAFTRGDGERFNPLSHAVKEFWIAADTPYGRSYWNGAFGQ